MTSTLLPNALWSSSGVFPATGGASLAAVLSDASDASFTKKTTGLAFDQIGMALQTATIASTAVIQSVQFTVRHSRPNAASAIWVQLAIGGTVPGSFIWKGNVVQLPGVHATYNYVSPAYDAGTRAWTQSDIDNLVVIVVDKSSIANACTIFEISALVTTNDRPVVTVTAPTGTISDTSTPLVSWTYTDTEGDLQVYYKVRIYSSGVYSGAGFDPELSANQSSANITGFGQDTGAYPQPSLNGAGTYRAYVQIGMYNGPYLIWSDWAFSSFTFAVSPPALPDLSGAWIPGSAAVSLKFSGHTNMLATDDADFVTTVGNWVADANCSVTRSTTQAMNGVASLRLSSTAAGTMSAALANTTAGREPVNPLQSYTATASFRAGATGRVCRVGIRWLNSATATIQTDYSTTITSTTAGWTTASYLFLPPSTAAYALVVVEVQSTAGAAELHYADEIAIYPGSAAGFVNLAPNPSVEVDLTGWSNFFSDPNVTITQDATHAFHGTKAVKASVTGSASQVNFGANVYGLVIGQTYTASVYVWNDATHPVPSINITIPFVVTGTSTSTTGSWVRLSVTWVATATSVFPVVQGAGGVASPMIFWADALQVEAGSTATTFSVATGAWTPGGYTGMTALIERSDDGGTTWTSVYGAPFTLDATTETYQILDYEASRGSVSVGGTPLYRAKAIAMNTANGLTISSDYTTPATVATVNDGQWWLKSLVNPALNMSKVRVKENVPYQTPEELGIFYPLGQKTAVVVHGDLHGENGSLQVITRGPTERSALDLLVARQDTLFLQDQQGYGKRIQWTGRARVFEGTANPEVSTYSIDYVAVS